MAELFIELLSEEIPAKLQTDARRKIKDMLDEKLKKKDEANQLKELSKISLANSEYWKKRFVSLNIH